MNQVSLQTVGSASDDAGRPMPTPRMRPAELLMTPARLSVLQPSRISVTRLFMAKAIRERWSVKQLRWNIDDRARGTALYRIETGAMPFDFVVHSFEPKKEGRIGRIIGRAWDMMAALIEGPVSEADITNTGIEIPKLYAGRATPGTLVWARSNRSGRAFDHTVEALSKGQQPDVPTLADVCYLMRNTGLDGNGTFGTRSFRALESDHPLRRPLDAQMLCAYMMRVFSVDLVNHLAHCRSPHAAELAPEIERFLGVGNGSALGLNFFVNNHPKLMHAFLSAREKAIVAAKSLPARAETFQRMLSLVDKAIVFRREDRMTYERFVDSQLIATELTKIRAGLQELCDTGTLDGVRHALPLAALSGKYEGKVHDEAHETLLGLMTHLVPSLCDALAEGFAVDEEYGCEPNMSLGHLRDLLRAEYGWAFKLDLASDDSRKYVWYKSATAEEPRRGAREELGDVHNLGLDLPRLIVTLDAELAARPSQMTIARFLTEKPELRSIAARVQTLSGYEYHSPHMNMMGEEFVPSDITRFINICIHGLDKPRDYLHRSLRGVIYQGAPTAEDLRNGAAPDWFLPAEPKQ